MTVETLSPSPAKEESKELSACDGSLHPVKTNTKANKVIETVMGPILPPGTQVGRLLSVRESSAGPSEWDERLLPSSQIRNKENKDYRKKGLLLTGTIPKKKLGGEGQGWKGFSEDVSLYKNLNTPMQPSKSGIAILSDKDDLANRKKGAIKKKTQMPTGNPLKRSGHNQHVLAIAHVHVEIQFAWTHHFGRSLLSQWGSLDDELFLDFRINSIFYL